jgi:putative sterol carrier protein
MSTPQVQQIIAEMARQLSANNGLNGTLKLDFGDAGSVLIDGKNAPNSVSDGSGKSADTTISMGLDTYDKIVRGELDRNLAFMQGKLRVMGDMAIAMKLGPVLPKPRA